MKITVSFTGRNLEFPGLGSPKKCLGTVNFLFMVCTFVIT